MLWNCPAPSPKGLTKAMPTKLSGLVLRNDVFRWGDRFMKTLTEAVAARGRYLDTQPKKLKGFQIQEA